jgi:Cyclic phosphodiesterase-like protein
MPRSVALSGYAIFTVPTGAIGAKLTTTIDMLAKRYGTQRFEPHVSISTTQLQGNVELIREKLKIATSKIPPLNLMASEFDHSDNYFRCVSLKVSITPELQRAYEVIEESFGNAHGAYSPHLSIVYDTLSRTAREAIIQDLSSSFKLPLNFQLPSAHLYSIHGTAKEWRSVNECPLTGRPE